MDLTILNEQQLQEFVRIVAEDFKIKYETLRRLQAKKEENIKLTMRMAKKSLEYVNDTVAQSLRNSSSTETDRRNRRCRVNRDELCKLCGIRSCVEQKQREWLILCPFKDDQFGYAKYLCKCPSIDDDEAWNLRAILELHIDYKLGVQIDTAYVCNFSTTGVLNKYRQKLIQALSAYNPSKPFQYIDDVISDVELNASEDCIIQCVLKSDQCDYFSFLSNAVISAATSQQSFAKPVSMDKTKLLHNINSNCEGYWENFQRTDSLLEITEPEVPFVNSLSVKMLKREWNVRTGDMIILFGIITSDNLDLTVSWFIGTKAIANGGRYRHWRKGFDCCLEIFDCDVSDSGNIKCVVEAANSIASDIAVLHVNVLKCFPPFIDDDIAGIEPKFLQILKYDEIYDCLQLVCRVSGYPIPYVTFHFRNRRIISNQRINIDRKNDWWILRINDCTVDDEGKYVAVARNRIGRIFSSCSVILSNKNPSTYIADV